MSPSAGRALLTLLSVCVLASSVRAEPPEPRAKLDHEAGVLCLAFSPDGKLLAAGDKDSTLRLWDPATAKEVGKLQIPFGDFVSLSFAPDGKTLASTSNDGWIRLWDVPAGKQIREFYAQERYPNIFAAYSPDGKVLASGWGRGALSIWDPATVKELHTMPLADNRVGSVAFSPSGRLVAVGLRDRTITPELVRSPQVTLWDPTTAKEVRQCECVASRVVFSPDGKTLAGYPDADRIRLIEAHNGVVRTEINVAVSALAYAPDGRFLAYADRTEHSIHVRDLVTNKEVLRLEEHEVEVHALAFSPDGKTLASASGDFTVLLWDTTALTKMKPSAGKLTAQELEALWKDLAGDSPRAYQARNRLVQVASAAGPALKERLDGVTLLDPRQLAQWVADLDSGDFNARQKATQELQGLGETARPALEQVLARKPSLEVRRRVEALLDKLEKRELSPEQLRVLRAVEVLELIATPEARQALEKLGKQTPITLLTQEALESSKRLTSRGR